MASRTYEIMFIVRPDLEEADLDKLIEGFKKNVTDGGGEILSKPEEEKWGRRRLAYTVRKFNDGLYVLLRVGAEGSLVAELERRLRVSEQVIKFITVRMDEEEKRLAKIKAHRDTHVKRSAIPVQPAHPFPSSAPPADTASESATPQPESGVTSAPAEAASTEPVASTEPAAEPAAAEPVSA